MRDLIKITTGDSGHVKYDNFYQIWEHLYNASTE